MTAKKKSKKKRVKVKTRAARAGASASKAARKKLVKKKATTKKKLPKKKLFVKRAEVKTKSPGKKKAVVKTAGGAGNRRRVGGQNLETEAFAPPGRTPGSAGQSGDLQGLSNVEGADSESVDELLEEGNAFEAEVVAGVESVGNADEKEVRTHEVPEDDVPGEYLDKD